MEGNPRPGEDPLASPLPSLPPRPEEISRETVSPLPPSGQAPHAEGRTNLRVSPLIAAAPSHGTTTSTNHSRMPADAEQLASAPAIAESSDSSSRAVPPPEPPHGSTSTDDGAGGAGSGISLLTSARIPTDLRMRSSVVTTLPPLTQGLTTILPPGGPSSGQPSHLAPDSNGAFPNADEQMVTTLASPLPPRGTTDHHWAIHLPTPVGPPLDGTINPNTHGARAVPTSQEDNFRPLRTCLPTPPPATSSDSATQNVGVARDAAGNLCGAAATSTGNLAHEAAMASGVPMAARATSLGSDSSRQSHPPTTHPNSGHLARGSAECWGVVNRETSPRDFPTPRLLCHRLQGFPWLHGQPLWFPAKAVSPTLPLPTQLRQHCYAER